MVVPAPANSVSAAAATLGMLVGADNSFAPLAEAEVILFPRFDVNERAVGSGCDFFFESWASQLIVGLPLALANAIPAQQMAL